MLFMVYYLESVYNKPWVENGQIQYTQEEIAEGLDFMNQLEDAHVIPTLAVLDGDMADSVDIPLREHQMYRGIFLEMPVHY